VAHRRPDPEELCDALHEGDPARVAALADAGADLRYVRAHGYDAVLDAVHGREISRDPRLLAQLSLLIARGARLDGVSSYEESAVRVLSNDGRFDAVRLLLDAGAPAEHLRWTPLMRAVALGTFEDVERELATRPSLEDRDVWERSAWLIALMTGDLRKAELLLDRGASGDARGRCQKPALFYAIDGHHPHVVRWLLEIGADVDQIDQFGTTALMHAVESHDVECLDVLLAAGADIDRDVNGSALHRARARDIVLRLLAAGADPSKLSSEGCRAVLGLPPDPDAGLMVASAEDFQRASTRRFGTMNPERRDERFWVGMIRSGISAYAAGQMFGATLTCPREPIWCAHRFGQSLTFLPDGRIVQIAGEHEDFYDPDFCIYNDVFVHRTDGSIEIYLYPKEMFPPTDFHTATLAGDHIYVIGSLGYQGERRYGEAPVFRLDTRTWRIDRIDVRGDGPGLIHGHRAALTSAREIRIQGGYVAVERDGREALDQNTAAFVLELDGMKWRREMTDD